MTTTDEPPTRPATIAARLGSCRDRLDELQEQLDQERHRRDQLVVEARDDEAMGYKTIARLAGISKSRVIAILAAH